MSEALSPRQLIVLCDGTNNSLTGGRNDTNVVKLAELFARHPNPERVVHYDPGVGNPGEMPGASLADKVKRLYERIEGLAIGRGVFENIAEAYIFLMRQWRHERDRIFLFGFSRGAFTARSVAGIISRFGLLQPHLEALVPTLLHHYFSAPAGDDAKAQAHYDQIAEQMTRLFCGGAPQQADGQPNPFSRRVYVYFIGVWDTVAAVGIKPFQLRFTSLPTVENKRFIHVRQALALDEYRAQFQQRLYLGENSQRVKVAGGLTGTLEQLWFRGAHCDVGGYYPPGQTLLSDRAMAWLVSEAVAVGLWLGSSAQVRNEGASGGEQAVLQALQSALPHAPQAHAVVHSELYDTPWWALAGMRQRETQRVCLDDGRCEPITPVAHASVAEFDADAHAGSLWVRAERRKHNRLKQPGTKLMLALCLLLCLLMPFVQGFALDACSARPGWLEWLGCLWGNNKAFQQWQLQGFNVFGGGWSDWMATLNRRFVSPRWALGWDFVFIFAYATVLCYPVSTAFAHIAGLRRIDEAPSRLLSTLGWALPTLVFADVAENLLGWLAITAAHPAVPLLHGVSAVAGIVAAVASLAKFAGLGAVIALLLWGLIPARR